MTEKLNKIKSIIEEKNENIFYPGFNSIDELAYALREIKMEIHHCIVVYFKNTYYAVFNSNFDIVVTKNYVFHYEPKYLKKENHNEFKAPKDFEYNRRPYPENYSSVGKDINYFKEDPNLKILKFKKNTRAPETLQPTSKYMGYAFLLNAVFKEEAFYTKEEFKLIKEYYYELPLHIDLFRIEEKIMPIFETIPGVAAVNYLQNKVLFENGEIAPMNILKNPRDIPNLYRKIYFKDKNIETSGIFQGFKWIEQAIEIAKLRKIPKEAHMITRFRGQFYIVCYEDYMKQIVIGRKKCFYRKDGYMIEGNTEHFKLPYTITRRVEKDVNTNLIRDFICVGDINYKRYIVKNLNKLEYEEVKDGVLSNFTVLLAVVFQDKFYKLDEFKSLKRYFSSISGFYSLAVQRGVQLINPFRQLVKFHDAGTVKFKVVIGKGYTSYKLKEVPNKYKNKIKHDKKRLQKIFFDE